MEKRSRQKRQELVAAISNAISACNAESVSDTPNFILAEYLVGCLESLEQLAIARLRWLAPPRREVQFSTLEELKQGKPLMIDQASIARAVPHSKANRDIKAKRAARRSSRSRRSG